MNTTTEAVRNYCKLAMGREFSEVDEEYVLAIAAERDAAMRRAEAAEAGMQAAIEHTDELEDAWQRGCIQERDGLGGTRSNRNVEVNRSLRAALAARSEPTQ